MGRAFAHSNQCKLVLFLYYGLIAVKQSIPSEITFGYPVRSHLLIQGLTRIRGFMYSRNGMPSVRLGSVLMFDTVIIAMYIAEDTNYILRIGSLF